MEGDGGGGGEVSLPSLSPLFASIPISRLFSCARKQFKVCIFSNSCEHCQKIKILPLKVDHVFDLEEAVGLLAHRSAVSYINEKEGHVMLRELYTRL